MKIGCVYAPRPKRWPKFRWVQDALETLGHETQQIGTPEALKAAKCDLMLFEHKSAGIGPNHIRDIAPHRTCHWNQWWFDAICTKPEDELESQPIWQTFGGMMQCFDSVFVKERGRVLELREHGINAAYLDQGCPSWIGGCEHVEEPEFDVVLFGNLRHNYGPRRVDVQCLVSNGFRVAWAGDGGNEPRGVERLPWTPTERLPELIGRARCTLSVNYLEADGYWSDRLWLALGAGAVVVAREMVGGPALPYLTYRNHAELIESIAVIRRMNDRQRIGESCRNIVMAEHTYEERLKSLLAAIEEPMP